MSSASEHVARDTSFTPARRLARKANDWLRHAFIADASPALVAICAAIPVIAAASLLIAADGVFGREMIWDLLFNLAGAWHVHNGHTPYVDFHDPLGPLNFHLTRLGYIVLGPTPYAFLMAEFIVLAGLFMAAMLSAVRRLPAIAAFVFIVYTALLVITPVNVGDLPNAYSFAMSYNHWGWSALIVLCLTLFVEPHRSGGAWIDALLSGLLLAFLFYVKVTFAVAGLAATLGAMAWMGHIRPVRGRWAAVLLILFVDVVSPHNRAYLNDVWQAADSGYVRGSLVTQLFSFVANGSEYALYGTAILLIVLLWRLRRAPGQTVLSALAVLGLGMFVLSQNAQTRGVPVGVVILFMIYDALRRQHTQTQTLRPPDMALLMVVVLTGPLLLTLSDMAAFVGYHRAATRDGWVWRPTDTNLRGLAVEIDNSDVNRAQVGARFFQRAPEVTSAHYLETLIEAAAFFADDRRGRPKILTLDQVNPLPFALGYTPPTGGNLWMAPESPQSTGDELLRDVDVILIPKFPTYAPSTTTALARYTEYMTAHFPVREESVSWTMLSRQDGRGGSLR